MRIVLVYPPAWKIPPTGEPFERPEDGPPPDLDAARLLTGDILSIPAGLLSLAAQAVRAGHEVTVLNLISFPWQEVVRILRTSPADIYGISCFTANRRGALSLARLVRQLHSAAHIVAGGPHASALPREMLAACDALDTVIIGEGEGSFAELFARLEQGQDTRGIAGTAWRDHGAPVVGPIRKRIENLDSLAPVCDFFSDYILITGRGCAWDCAFCSSKSIWGPVVRAHSPAYILDALATMVNRRGLTAVAIKDETFTANRGRVLSICRGIQKRKLNFLWSCDTRADCLDDEMLCMMRSAGCRRISLGIESGSPRILKSLNKHLKLSAVRRAIAAAKRFGLHVRLYMIVGSPEETLETLQRSIAFVERLQPHEVIWNPFTLLPGTGAFLEAEQHGSAARKQFFTEDFFELIPIVRDSARPDRAAILAWLHAHQGLQRIGAYSVRAQQKILRLFPELHSAHLDYAHACLREGRVGEAQAAIEQAARLGYPQPGIIENYRACIAALQGDIREALARLLSAKKQGFHAVVERNIASAQAWAAAGGPACGRPLELEADNSFEVTRPMQQPLTPGPVAA